MKSKITLTLLKLLLLTPVIGIAQWSPIKSYPGGITDGVGSFVIGSKIYFAGGNGSSKLYEYNPANNTWSPKKAIGGGLNRAWSAVFSVNQKGYVMGGSYATATDLAYDLWEYDVLTDDWTKKADFPGGKRDGMYVFVIGGIAYMGGGFNGAATVGDFWKYEAATNQWTQLNTPPFGAVIFASTFVVNGKAYVTGGDRAGTEQSGLYEYDPSTDTWTSKKPLPGSARQAAFAFASATEGYIGGGMSKYTTTFKDMWKYNPSTDVWKQVDSIPSGYAAWSVAAVANNAAYVGTGANFSGSAINLTDSMYQYKLPSTNISDRLSADTFLVVYPNPAHNEITLNNDDFDLKGMLVSIYDINGRSVYGNPVVYGKKIDIQNLNPGTYFIIAVSQSGSVFRSRFIRH